MPYFSLDWRLQRPFNLGGDYKLIPSIEMFNTFNNANNANPLSTPAPFNFDGFLRAGVGDPRQMQLATKFTFHFRLVDALLDGLLRQVHAGRRQQTAKALARVAITPLVVPERVIAVECDEIEEPTGHARLYSTRDDIE